jgi:hypothetical protein
MNRKIVGHRERGGGGGPDTLEPPIDPRLPYVLLRGSHHPIHIHRATALSVAQLSVIR